MSLFAQIDPHLTRFAAEQPAVLTRDRNGMSLLLAGPNRMGFEERRLAWQREAFNLAIILQPDFLVTGVDVTKWNFVAVAWQGSGSRKRTARKAFLKSVPFQEMEAKVAELLAQARTYLNHLHFHDLKPQGNWH
jgi:hypothetical protein